MVHGGIDPRGHAFADVRERAVSGPDVGLRGLHQLVGPPWIVDFSALDAGHHAFDGFLVATQAGLHAHQGFLFGGLQRRFDVCHALSGRDNLFFPRLLIPQQGFLVGQIEEQVLLEAAHVADGGADFSQGAHGTHLGFHQGLTGGHGTVEAEPTGDGDPHDAQREQHQQQGQLGFDGDVIHPLHEKLPSR